MPDSEPKDGDRDDGTEERAAGEEEFDGDQEDGLVNPFDILEDVLREGVRGVADPSKHDPNHIAGTAPHRSTHHASDEPPVPTGQNSPGTMESLQAFRVEKEEEENGFWMISLGNERPL